jgi:2-dehydro-3-deoxyphosphogluconate aldolase/(4S)-4-hydroxy-2-oxoglutarate aldolase
VVAVDIADLPVPVIAILRGVDSAFFGKVMAASFGAGLDAIEVTMNTEGAEEMIARNRPLVPAGKLLGAGTVRSEEEAEEALNAGAMFLVTPNLDAGVIARAASAGVPVVAGAMTPTEVHAAWKAGAAMVKVFPCGALGGAQYIRELRGPFDNIPLVAVGGVNRKNLPEYFAAGARAVGVSTALFGGEALARKDIRKLTGNVKDFIRGVPMEMTRKHNQDREARRRKCSDRK